MTNTLVRCSKRSDSDMEEDVKSVAEISLDDSNTSLWVRWQVSWEIVQRNQRHWRSDSSSWDRNPRPSIENCL